MSLINTVLIRNFEKCNFSILKSWYDINKNIIEENFYKNDILVSGTIRDRVDSTIEILYLKYFAEKPLHSKEILHIYSIGEKIFPTYEEYSLLAKSNDEIDLTKKIIQKLVPSTESTIVNTGKYYEECEKIKLNLSNPFVSSVSPKKKNIKQSSGIKCKAEVIKEKELSFVGIVLYISADSFRNMICYKILEKIFGSNDIYGMYFRFRERGWIYTGLSGYVIEKNIFYTGAIMQYNKEHEREILTYLDTFSFSVKEFENAKNMVFDDYRYSLLQYGEEFTLLPYRLQIENANDFEDCLSKIAVEDVEKVYTYLHEYGTKIRMKVI